MVNPITSNSIYELNRLSINSNPETVPSAEGATFNPIEDEFPLKILQFESNLFFKFIA